MTEGVVKAGAVTVLIADDDPMLRAIASELLADEGYRILEAEDGDEALRQIQAEPVDLIVLDMLMPNKDGLETIIELRRRRSDVRILAISSGGSMDVDSLLRPALAFGADRILSKPLRYSTFAPTIAEMLKVPAGNRSPFSSSGLG
jgi:CheY-like chemotaxis protein